MQAANSAHAAQCPPDRSPPDRFPSDLGQLENDITELAAHLSAATCRLLEMIREFDRRGGWHGVGIKSCAHWLNWKCGIALGAAREKVRVAHALADLPGISAAFGRGRVSYSKVRAMTRVATPENEDYLLMIADHGTATHVERLVRNYRRVKRNEALARDRRSHALRGLDWYIDDDGSYVIRARLTAEQGARFAQAIEQAMDVPAGTPTEDEIPVSARRADALERIGDSYLTNGRGGVSGGERSTLHIHTDIDTLRADGEGAEAGLAGGGTVCAESARRLACDCGVVHWQADGEGNALNIGRRSRSIPPASRRALERRDQGCRFPGCTTRHHVDAHHIQHWADGGETKLDNLVLLCRHHHRLVHEGGYGVAMKGEGKPVFTGPDGRVIPAGPETRSRGNVFAITAAHRSAGLQINPRTLIPQWNGDRMDDNMAVDALIQRE
jgi:uncharacterized protein (DUF1684 family)